MIQLPHDNPETFKNIPLSGHICSMRRGNEKLYWQVEGLIKASQNLSVFQANIDELISKFGNSTWFGPYEKPTIAALLSHLKRAISADLNFPIILSADGKIMDGSHRVVGASLKGLKTIPAVQFLTDPNPDYVEMVSDSAI